jgi:hypothetical protein
MPTYSLASFKNSRISTRQATTEGDTFQVPVALGPTNTLLAAANTNRTYLTIRNTSAVAGEDMYYDYFDNPNMLTEGFLLKNGEAADLESPEAIYAQAVVAPITVDCDEGSG